MARTISTDPSLARLLAWLSPAYPVGAFSYSHGLEMAVEEGAVTRRDDLVAYVEAALLHGAGAVDAGLLALAWRAAGAGAVPLREACFGWLAAFAANIVSAGVRLVPLGQTDGQIATATLLPAIARATDAALAVTDADELGSAAPLLDLFSMRHETQYTRLFRS